MWARTSRDNRLAILLMISYIYFIYLSIHHSTAVNITSELMNQLDSYNNEKQNDVDVVVFIIFRHRKRERKIANIRSWLTSYIQT